MPDNDTIPGTMPNEAAAEWLRGKALTNARVLRDMKPEVRARAFAVSGIEDMRRLKEVREAVAGIPEGGSWEEARDKVAEALGDPERTRARAETVVRTNAFQAYSAARYRAQMADKEVFPFLKYVTVGDDRVRDSHKALDGLVLRKDDDFWKDHYPPWDWGCRCIAVELTEGMAEEERREGDAEIRDEEWSRRWRAAHHAADEARDFHNRPGQLTVALDEVAFDEKGKERYTRDEMAGFNAKMEKAAVELPDGTVKTVRDWMWEPVREKALQEVLKAERSDGKHKREHAVMLDRDTGGRLDWADGEENTVEPDWSKAEGREVAVYHNHPGGDAHLSPMDLYHAAVHENVYEIGTMTRIADMRAGVMVDNAAFRSRLLDFDRRIKEAPSEEEYRRARAEFNKWVDNMMANGILKGAWTWHE